MKKLLLILSIIVIVKINAQYQGPIPEITQGYGSFGTYANDTLITIENTTVPSNELADRTVSIFYSKSVVLPAPTVMIAPGWGQFSPSIFEHLIDFIVSKGCVVVFAPTQSNGGSWFDNHYSGMQMAVDSFSNIIDTTQIGIFGHSVGGGAVAWLGKKLFMDKNYGLSGRFMFASSAWINFEITQNDLVNYPEDVAFIMQYYEEDTGFVSPNGTDPRYGIDIYNNINIPASEKDFIMVKSSDVSAYHYTTDHSIYSGNTYDALDFYGLFRLIDALIDYKFNGNCAAKYVCLGNGGPKQIDMGQMNDLDVNADITILPQSHYDYPCNSGSNPRAAYCNETLQVEPFIDYIDSVLINTATCNVLDTGIFISTFSNQHSCDSVVTTYKTLLPSDDTTVYLSSCLVSDTGHVLVVYTKNNGCDSIVHTVTNLFNSNDTIIYFSDCDISDTLIVINSLSNINGCDSLVTEITYPLRNNDTTFYSYFSQNVSDTGITYHSFMNSYGCDSVYIVHVMLSTPDKIEENYLKAFSIKNPVHNILHLTSYENIQNISIFNLVGEKQIDINENIKDIDVRNLSKSVYILKIKTADKYIYTKIIIK